jgi:hypothetical protein
MSETTTDQGFDFEPAYRERGGSAIAWRVDGYEQEWTQESWTLWNDDPDADPEDESNYDYNEPEQIEDRSRVVAHMIGDDRPFTFDVDDLEPIKDDDYCSGCGQISCGWC